MKNLNSIFRTLTLTLVALFITSSAAFAGTLDGTWLNTDANTRGLTKVIISNNNSKFKTWGSCSPTDCAWGTTAMRCAGSSYSAYYNQGFATRKLTITKLGNGKLRVIVKTKYKDSRPDRTAYYYFKKQPVFIPTPGLVNFTPVLPVSEDCLSIDYKTAKVKCINGDWKIVDGPTGSHWAFSFGNKRSEAYKALHIIKCYKITQSCYVGRPGPSLEYILKDGKAPQGATANEDCVSFNPNTLKMKKINNRYKLVDGNHWVFDFGSKKSEALKSLQIIKKHKFTKSCYVGRPGPSFEYMRK